MVISKIARGTTGQATFESTQNIQGATVTQWVLIVPGANRPPFASDSSANGWNVAASGVITVPADALLGGCRAFFLTNITENGVDSTRQDTYLFEVVCMTTKITVVETYRDENVYRLTCTATPQGGTAPYIYSWLSDVTGSQALSALNQATLEVEIPASVSGFGSISVAVSDSSNPACTASASFKVCESVTCNFTTALISTQPTGETEYECVSSSSSNYGYLVHKWSPEPTEISAEGRVAKFSFPDDDEHSIHLSVRDILDCHGFKTHKVGGYEFTISTDPDGEDTGTMSGTRDTMEFTVTVTAKATGNFTGTTPPQLMFEFFRPATNEVGTAVAPLVAGSNPPRYEFPWLVRQAKGRWQIKVQGYKSNTATFKIDKRKQIVEVANSWVGARQDTGHGGIYCDDLCRYFYEYTGLVIGGGGNNVVALYNSIDSSTQDTKKGAIAFYHFPTDPNTTWRHNAMNVSGGLVVDQNCGHEHSKIKTETDPFGLPQEVAPATVGQHPDVDPALVNPSKYAAPSYYSTSELQSLDGE